MQDYSRRTESTKSQEHGFGVSLVNHAVVPEAETHDVFHSPPSPIHLNNHTGFRCDKDEILLADPHSPHKSASASVRSMSSTENSRRDSAVSAGSQQRQRPKTSRSMSKRSLQSANGDALSRTSTSRSGPPRPRGHRFSSSTSINVPHTNIEEALAFHARSCAIVSATSRPSTPYSPTTSPYGSSTRAGHYQSLSSDDALPMSRQATQQPSPYGAHANQSAYEVADEEDNYFSTSFPATVMHWTSDEKRMKEYAAIDRSNTGVRGLLKKLLPKCVTKGQPKFYDEKDGSDCGSVRRIRLDFPADKDESRRSVMPRRVTTLEYC